MFTIPEWMERGLCSKFPLDYIDEYFFAEAGMKGNRAKKICQKCPVRQDCRNFGLIQTPTAWYGIWGGLNQADRLYYHREFPELIVELRARAGFVPEPDYDSEEQVDPLNEVLALLGLPPVELSEVLTGAV